MLISIHAPAWGATPSESIYRSVCSISIHAPAWGATLPIYMMCDAYRFQSTHPHGVRLLQLTSQGEPIGISIHAPAWGATVTAYWHDKPTLISIHAPAWGATRPSMRFRMWALYFNPRTRMGCDGASQFMAKVIKTISIHAPAWGATNAFFFASAIMRYFNPRTRMGCDLLPSNTKTQARNFNPRTRMGCDA